MYEVKESDWKLFRKKIAGWQESYMERLVEEYIKLLQSNKSSSEKFWELEDRIFKYKRKKGVIVEMARSKMYWNLISLLQEDAIILENLKDFSSELQEDIKECLERWKR